MNFQAVQYLFAMTIVTVNIFYHLLSKLEFHTGPIQNFTLIFLNAYLTQSKLEGFKYKELLKSTVFMWTLHKMLAAFLNIKSQITISILTRQTIADTSLILRDLLGYITGKWIPKFIHSVLPLMATSAYLVVI